MLEGVCKFTMKRRDPDRPDKSAWCETHDRWAEVCSGDPLESTLRHLVKDAEKPVKTCPHCGEVLE